MGGTVEGDKVDAFLRWAAEIGVSDSPSPAAPSHPSSSSCLGQSLVLSHFPDAGGRGLAAARELKKGERVLRVPKRALLTRESVLQDEKLAACVKRHPHLSSTQILTICLLAEVEKGRSSRWYLYLIQLPQSYDTLANFSQIETKSLQAEDAIWVSEKIELKVRSDWKEAVSLMREMALRPQLLTFKSWLWASATVSQFHLVHYMCHGTKLVVYALLVIFSIMLHQRMSVSLKLGKQKLHLLSLVLCVKIMILQGIVQKVIFLLKD